MQSIAEFRHNMIDGQLEPNQVLSAPITAAMGVVPREMFVPEDYQHAAYIDEPIPLDKQRYLAPPLLLGQLLEALKPAAGQKILVMGAGTGYAAAVAHQLGCRTYMLEESQDLANKARQILMQQGLSAIEVHTGSLQMGWNAGGPYDRILVEGGAQLRPDAWTKQLAEGGVLAYVAVDTLLPLPHRGRGFIKTVRRVGDHLAESVGAGVATPLLPGLEKKEGFQFG